MSGGYFEGGWHCRTCDATFTHKQVVVVAGGERLIIKDAENCPGDCALVRAFIPTPPPDKAGGRVKVGEAAA